MGIFHSMFASRAKTGKLVVVGLDHAGKTTVLKYIGGEDDTLFEAVPTVGMDTKQVKVAGVTFDVFDMGGDSRYRSLWETKYGDVDGIVFVVDSADKMRIAVAKDELHQLLKSKHVSSRNVPLLVLANKQDLDASLSAAEIGSSFELQTFSKLSFHVQGTCALNGDGVIDGMAWLSDEITKIRDEASKKK